MAACYAAALMDRRAFLKTLGIGGGAIAFAASHPWNFPETIVPYSGPFSFEWMASEITATIAAKLHGMKLSTDPEKDRIWSGATQRYCQFLLDSKQIAAMTLDQVRRGYIIPVATSMAEEIIEIRPKMCGVLLLPGGIDTAHSCTDTTTGLNLRFIRAYDITSDRFLNRCDVLIA